MLWEIEMRNKLVALFTVYWVSIFIYPYTSDGNHLLAEALVVFVWLGTFSMWAYAVSLSSTVQSPLHIQVFAFKWQWYSFLVSMVVASLWLAYWENTALCVAVAAGSFLTLLVHYAEWHYNDIEEDEEEDAHTGT